MDIRLVSDHEAEACNDFHNRIWGDQRTLAQWRWDFTTGPASEPHLPFAVALDDGRVVGTQALIPIRMIDRTGVFWTAKSEETLVDPDYRGQKLFDRMYELLFGYANRNDLRYIWGFTTATKAFVKLGFATPGKTSQLLFPFSARVVDRLIPAGDAGDSKARLALYRVAGAGGRLVSSFRFAASGSTSANREAEDSLEVRTASEPPDEAGDVCRRFIERFGGVTIYRDSDYLRWRVFENPHVRGTMKVLYFRRRLVGWVIYAMGDDGVGYLVDLMAVPGDGDEYSIETAVRRLLREAVLGTRNMGAVAIRGWHVNNHPFDALVLRAARKVGFYHLNRGHMMVVFDSDSKAQGRPRYGFDEWFITRIFAEGVLG